MLMAKQPAEISLKADYTKMAPSIEDKEDTRINPVLVRKRKGNELTLPDGI
jgi:hypothetical protein